MPFPHPELPTPAVLIATDRLEANLRRMQEVCDRAGVELWPHAKTHKMVAVARRQLALGARGLTCAKLGEAEALVPSGVRRVFLAHSLVDPGLAPRLRQLAAQLDELILAVTSEPQARALHAVLEAAGLSVPVLLAVDTGLGREGVRTPSAGVALAALLRSLPRFQLRGLYTHEGHAYTAAPAARAALVDTVLARLTAVRDAIDPQLSLWPGCSVTATALAGRSGVRAVRPGAYVFNDLYLAETTAVTGIDTCALTVLATVVDRPEPGLALIDAGSKVLGNDRTPAGHHARAAARDAAVTRCNEEHGYITGGAVDELEVGDRLALVPAHVCPVVNLASEVVATAGQQIVERWPVEARGRVN